MSELADPTPLEPPAENHARPRRSLLKRVLIGVVATFTLLAIAAVVLYRFGGMSGSVNDPAMKQQYAQLVATGAAQPVQKAFVIGIPGCQCHSTDPVLTEQHRNRRIYQCSSCHNR